jgi:hypothetical protein
MRGVKKNNRFGILLIAAMTIPFWLVALILWFTVFSSDGNSGKSTPQTDKTVIEKNKATLQ